MSLLAKSNYKFKKCPPPKKKKKNISNAQKTEFFLENVSLKVLSLDV